LSFEWLQLGKLKPFVKIKNYESIYKEKGSKIDREIQRDIKNSKLLFIYTKLSYRNSSYILIRIVYFSNRKL